MKSPKYRIKIQKLNLKMKKTQFENAKTQFTGDLLAWTGRAMRSKKALTGCENSQNKTLKKNSQILTTNSVFDLETFLQLKVYSLLQICESQSFIVYIDQSWNSRIKMRRQKQYSWK